MSNTFLLTFLGATAAICAVNLLILLVDNLRDYVYKKQTDAFWNYMEDLEFEDCED